MGLKFLCRLEPKSLVLQDMGDKKVSWVQVFRKGAWKHPRYGPLKFTDEIFNGFIKNFNDRVRKIDLAIDTEHEPEKGACGWITRVEARADEGLWALVEWTSRGLQLVADGVFKYLSGDFDYEWKDDETGKKYHNVLFGAALTNRPFIKGMSPINLSEFKKELENDENIRNTFQLAEDVLKLKEEDKVMRTDAELLAVTNDADLTPEEKDRKAILLKKQTLSDRAKKIGLAEDATEDDIKKKELQDTEEEDLKNRAKAVGLAEDATEEDVKKKELADAEEDIKKRAKAVDLAEDATEDDVVKKEKELADAKVALAERAKSLGLSESATLEEVVVQEKKVAVAGSGVIGNENEQKVAASLGLPADATLAQIHAVASTFVKSVAGRIEGSKLTMSERAKSVGLSETAAEGDVVAKEKELSEKNDREAADVIIAMDVPALEMKLTEMKEIGAGALTLKLLEDSIASKKTLHEERVKNSKEKIELRLKEHFRAGKLTGLERDTLKAILFSEIDAGETSYKLSEKDKDGKIVEATKTLNEVMDVLLNDRPAIIELKEVAKKELIEPPKNDGKELSEGEADTVAARIAKKVTGSSKSAKLNAARAKKVGLPETATLAEIEKKEKETN